jgi:hypothetical protein
LPFVVAAPAIERLNEPAARDDLFCSHEQIVLTARARRETLWHDQDRVSVFDLNASCVRSESSWEHD